MGGPCGLPHKNYGGRAFIYVLCFASRNCVLWCYRTGPIKIQGWCFQLACFALLFAYSSLLFLEIRPWLVFCSIGCSYDLRKRVILKLVWSDPNSRDFQIKGNIFGRPLLEGNFKIFLATPQLDDIFNPQDFRPGIYVKIVMTARLTYNMCDFERV